MGQPPMPFHHIILLINLRHFKSDFLIIITRDFGINIIYSILKNCFEKELTMAEYLYFSTSTIKMCPIFAPEIKLRLNLGEYMTSLNIRILYPNFNLFVPHPSIGKVTPSTATAIFSSVRGVKSINKVLSLQKRWEAAV